MLAMPDMKCMELDGFFGVSKPSEQLLRLAACLLTLSKAQQLPDLELCPRMLKRIFARACRISLSWCVCIETSLSWLPLSDEVHSTCTRGKPHKEPKGPKSILAHGLTHTANQQS